jgi:hypothetical protein
MRNFSGSALSEQGPLGGSPCSLNEGYAMLAIVPDLERFTIAHYECCRSMADMNRTFGQRLDLHC